MSDMNQGPNNTEPPTAAATATDPGTVPGDAGQTPPAAAPAAAAPSAPPATPAPVGAPEQYADFALPDGATVSNEAKALFKDLGLTQEQAQKAVTFQAENAQKQMAAVRDQWLADARADGEIGGAAFDANVQLAEKAIATFGSDALRALLEKSGLGNHPELVRAFVRVGKAISEDKLVVGGGGSAPPAKTPQGLYSKSNMNP